MTLGSEESIPWDPEEMGGALDELFLLAKGYRKSAKFQELLRFVSRFRRYSAFNAMLVHIQMPGARYVLPAKAWKEHGCLPREGAQPLVMLRPGGPVMFAFDSSQVEGKLPPEIKEPLSASGNLRETEFDRTVQNARRLGVEVQSLPMGSGLGGYIRNAADARHVIGLGLVRDAPASLPVDTEQVPCLARIQLNSNHSLETRYATLTHELGHLLCGHLGKLGQACKVDRRSLSVPAREFEAESVSYLVCQRAGLETPAVEYLASYVQAHASVPDISLDLVFQSAKTIEDMRKRSPSRGPRGAKEPSPPDSSPGRKEEAIRPLLRQDEVHTKEEADPE